MLEYKIDVESLKEMLSDLGIKANVYLQENGYCEVGTEETTYLITKEI